MRAVQRGRPLGGVNESERSLESTLAEVEAACVPQCVNNIQWPYQCGSIGVISQGLRVEHCHKGSKLNRVSYQTIWWARCPRSPRFSVASPASILTRVRTPSRPRGPRIFRSFVPKLPEPAGTLSSRPSDPQRSQGVSQWWQFCRIVLYMVMNDVAEQLF